ncbi:MAG: beta-phosphoglucomutase family hydrolase [Mariniblastus sp.]
MTSHSFAEQHNPDSTGLIFDCDGTLADTMPLHFKAWNSVATKYGIDFDEKRFYAMAGQPTLHIVQVLLVEQSISGDAVAITEEKENAFLEFMPEVQPIQPIVEIARRYHGTKPMGVGSGSNRDVVFEVLKLIGVDDLFDVVVGAEDTERHKPEPDVFLEVARQIKVTPTECIVYEDADLGVEAAKRAGMKWFDVRTIHTPARVSSS